jgi:hypothetical protein
MKTHFATLISTRYWTQETILQAKSLRAFGGDFADQPITAFIPKGQDLSPEIQQQFDQLSIQLAEYSLPEAAGKFPLGFIPFGAAAAEKNLAKQCDILVWQIPDTLILAPPVDFVLPEDKDLAYRPVHHQNVGSTFSQPPDDFWQQIYKHTEIPDERLFKMVTCYREEVRPYFNAGILTVRPELGILRQWAKVFEHTYQHPDFTAFYEEQRYAIFMHQAVLAGVILNQLAPEQLLCLPESYNYPLHMHAGYPSEGKISSLSDLVTARYENTLELPEFIEPFEDKASILELLPG